MIQKTYHIRDCVQSRLREILTEVGELDAYRGAGQVLAIVLEQNFDKALISEKTGMITEMLPKAEVVGVNHFDSYDPAEAEHKTTILTFMFFERRVFAIDRTEMTGMTESEAGKALVSRIRGYSPLKGVLLFVSHERRDIEAVLSEADEEFYDVPFFGSTAAALEISAGKVANYIFDKDGIYKDTIISVSFFGSELDLRVTYNYGWTPVGKTMTVTGTNGDFCVTGIDDKPAAEIYEHYLGLDYTKGMINPPNICEFPLIIEKNGLVIGRVPYEGNKEGELHFGAAVRKGSRIRFSYGAQHLILSETYNDSKAFGRFTPQGMFMIVCGSRLIFLKEDENREIGYYRRICPDLAFTHGNSEIYRCKGAGGELHAALIAFGLREGEKDRSILQCTVPPYSNKKDRNTIVPIEHRITSFLHAVTKDLAEMTRQANAANEAKSAFLANMSHDIRTPINAVLGMDEMILRECDDANVLAYAENIRTAGNTLLGLVNDILDFSKIEAGKLDIIPVDYDLASVLNDLVNMIQTRAAAKGLELKLDVDRNVPKLLHGDEIRIKQIITNILTNAVKYTEKGSVTFSVGFDKLSNDSITLKVSIADTGIGIKQEDLPKLFTQFERIEEARNRSIEGTGLGMNITQRLLAMMDSTLKVESEYGKGSVFSFDIVQQVTKWEPVGDYEEAFRRSLANRKKYREKFTAPDARILVVDDTPMNIEVFVSLLKKTLIRIDTAVSGADGIALAEKTKYDIIFLDHMMPDKDGIETLREIRETPDSPNSAANAVCLTANAVSGAREKYLAAGFDDYLTKPIEPDALEDMLLQYLPPEKLRAPSEADAPSAGSAASALPAFLYDIDELDIKEGVRHCGGEELFMQTAATYAGAVSGLTDEIERYRGSGDIANTTVKVHALKSTSRVIGAMEIGDLAEKLEAAGNARDTAALDSGLDELLGRCRRLGEQLSRLLDSGSLPLLPEDELQEVYTLIREFLSVADYESTVGVIGGLEEYSYPDSEKERCEALKRAAAAFDYDAISDIISQGE